jgi:hypothetical protein
MVLSNALKLLQIAAPLIGVRPLDRPVVLYLAREQPDLRKPVRFLLKAQCQISLPKLSRGVTLIEGASRQ